MKTIYKYPLEIKDYQAIDMPIGAEILTVQTQNAIPCIWAMVDPDLASVKYEFGLFGTGFQISDEFKGKYIGTYQLSDGAFVGHVF